MRILLRRQRAVMRRGRARQRRPWSRRADLVLIASAAALVSCAGPDETAGNGGDDLARIVDDLNDYWSVTDADLGFDYTPVPTSRISAGGTGLLCNAATVEPGDVAGNAFVDPSCAEGITVVYDPVYLRHSTARAEATLAHEWGHVIQAQATDLDLSAEPEGLPVDAELQADCFAGAWAAERAETAIELLRADTARAGDPPGGQSDAPDAHGTAAQRAAAFDIGSQGGPGACLDELMDALPG